MTKRCLRKKEFNISFVSLVLSSTIEYICERFVGTVDPILFADNVSHDHLRNIKISREHRDEATMRSEFIVPRKLLNCIQIKKKTIVFIDERYEPLDDHFLRFSYISSYCYRMKSSPSRCYRV